MRQDQFQAILAHEYGHFSHHDTAGGDIAFRVRAAMEQMAHNLATSGQARLYNPVWLFLNGFNRLFLRITRGASRLQEVLADRTAVLAYGPQALVTGLTQTIRQGLSFHMQSGCEIDAALDQSRDLPNLFVIAPPQSGELAERIEAAISQEMNRLTSPYDSHLAPGERIALIERIDADLPADENPGPVWDLMADAGALQAEMMGLVSEGLQQWGARAGSETRDTPQPEEQRPRLGRSRLRVWVALLAILAGIVVVAWGLSISSIPWIAIGGTLVVAGAWIRYGRAIRARMSGQGSAVDPSGGPG
jgi:hypothetical protein